jgi:hypothetical protein
MPSNTSRVLRVLTAADDFLNAREIGAAAGLNRKEVQSALWGLQLYHAVEAVESMGRLYWFSMPHLDTRIRVTEERRKEDEARRPKRQRARAITLNPTDIR